MALTATAAPCAVEAKLWRECLKQFDYGPERIQGACEQERSTFYKCMKDWRKETTGTKYNYHDYDMVKECAAETSELHQCMMINMFEMSMCEMKMNLLKKCAAKHDKLIREALADDPVIAPKSITSRTAQLVEPFEKLWHRIVGAV